MQPPAFIPKVSSFSNQVTDRDQVAQFAKLGANEGVFIEFLRFVRKQFQALTGPFQTDVAAHDADVARHYFFQFFCALRDENLFLRLRRSSTVPVRNVLT